MCLIVFLCIPFAKLIESCQTEYIINIGIELIRSSTDCTECMTSLVSENVILKQKTNHSQPSQT